MQDEQIKAAKGKLCTALAAIYESGAREVLVYYSGYGDSGLIHSVRFGDTSLGQASSEFQAIADWVEEHLPEGWEIDDGGQGEAKITLSGGTELESASLAIRHEVNYTHVETELYDDKRSFNAPS